MTGNQVEVEVDETLVRLERASRDLLIATSVERERWALFLTVQRELASAVAAADAAAKRFNVMLSAARGAS